MIIGIDPGTQVTGWAALDEDGCIIQSGRLLLTGTIAQRLVCLSQGLAATLSGLYLQHGTPTLAAVEDVSRGRYIGAGQVVIAAYGVALSILGCYPLVLPTNAVARKAAFRSHLRATESRKDYDQAIREWASALVGHGVGGDEANAICLARYAWLQANAVNAVNNSAAGKCLPRLLGGDDDNWAEWSNCQGKQGDQHCPHCRRHWKGNCRNCCYGGGYGEEQVLDAQLAHLGAAS